MSDIKTTFISSLKTEIYELTGTDFFAELLTSNGTQCISYCLNIIKGCNFEDRLCVFSAMIPKHDAAARKQARKELDRYLQNPQLCIRLWCDVRDP